MVRPNSPPLELPAVPYRHYLFLGHLAVYSSTSGTLLSSVLDANGKKEGGVLWCFEAWWGERPRRLRVKRVHRGEEHEGFRLLNVDSLYVSLTYSTTSIIYLANNSWCSPASMTRNPLFVKLQARFLGTQIPASSTFSTEEMPPGTISIFKY
ncbi:hypothetical protein VTK73DRAFT_9184 [Phialemonium thermophilum]|uniref:Uncharacterized protein n=1 Tax=Phialemonium thermophilum TaxID=223376 RepID=A0ABR3W3Y1_9PEZI